MSGKVLTHHLNTPQLKEVAAQVFALDEREDIELFTYEDTIAQYNNYLTNYGGWDENKRCHYWQRRVGGAQFTWPSCVVAQFTERKLDNKTSWTEKNINFEVSGSYFHEWSFKEWGKTIAEGFAWYRGSCNEPRKISHIQMSNEQLHNVSPHVLLDLVNCVLRQTQQQKNRDRLSSEFRDLLSQEFEATAISTSTGVCQV